MLLIAIKIVLTLWLLLAGLIGAVRLLGVKADWLVRTVEWLLYITLGSTFVLLIMFVWSIQF